MAIQSKPIPALYVVYILRSTVRSASLYIGSTPHPPRRLKQHNGIAKGGASRTAQDRLRPWEMVGIVSGFPSTVGALKFEYVCCIAQPSCHYMIRNDKPQETDDSPFRWALNNPHLSLHIAPEDRIVVPTKRKRGRPKRPSHSMISILSNLHLLLRVPSFGRWPLNLHFFDRQVHRKWEKYCAGPGIEPLRSSLEVLTDFAPTTNTEAVDDREEAEAPKSQATSGLYGKGPLEPDERDEDGSNEEDVIEEEDAQDGPQGWGIHALPLNYAPFGSYVEKAQNITSFEREGECVVCQQHLEHDKGLYAICSNGECEGTGHLDCWGRHLLQQKGEGNDDGTFLPMDGQCPKCNGTVKWADMMKELTLRTRGQKDVELLLKRRQRAANAKAKKAKKTKASGKGKAAGASQVLAAGSPSPKKRAAAKSKVSVKERAKAKTRA